MVVPAFDTKEYLFLDKEANWMPVNTLSAASKGTSVTVHRDASRVCRSGSPGDSRRGLRLHL